MEFVDELYIIPLGKTLRDEELLDMTGFRV